MAAAVLGGRGSSKERGGGEGGRLREIACGSSLSDRRWPEGGKRGDVGELR